MKKERKVFLFFFERKKKSNQTRIYRTLFSHSFWWFIWLKKLKRKRKRKRKKEGKKKRKEKKIISKKNGMEWNEMKETLGSVKGYPRAFAILSAAFFVFDE